MVPIIVGRNLKPKTTLDSNQPPASTGEQKIVSYRTVRGMIRSGDVLLFRAGRRLSNRLIARGTRSHYAHAAMAAWWNGTLMCLEMLQTTGGRAVTFSSQICGYPQQWDVYRARPGIEFDAHRAVEAMLRMTGTPYGWPTLFRCAVRRLPIVRLLVSPPSESDDRPALDERGRATIPDDPLHCSAAVSRALRAGRLDPVANLPDWATTPGDLSRSALLEYRFTIDQ